MSLYAFTDAQGNVEVLIDCHPSQIEIQPQNQDLPLRFDITGQIDDWQQTDLMCVNTATGKVQFKPAPLPLAPTSEELAAQARLRRNDMLTVSDWTQMPDSPVDRQAWAAYRQALRDVTGQDGFPHNIIWPIPPNP
jgi:hypothetical protein